MRINPATMATSIFKYEKAIRQEKANPSVAQPKDSIELSGNAKTYNKLIKAAMTEDESRSEKIHSIMNQIAAGTYRIDADKIAEAMIKRA